MTMHVSQEQVGTKVCTKCGNEWTLDAFSPHSTTWDRLQPWCKPCVNEKVQAYQRRAKELDPEGFRARNLEAVRAYRQRTGNVKGKAYRRAYQAAATRLINAHPEEFSEYLADARAEEEAR
jgi:hypothetical protein